MSKPSSSAPLGSRKCEGCGASDVGPTKFKACQCRLLYCSKHCQRVDRPFHKEVCIKTDTPMTAMELAVEAFIRKFQDLFTAVLHHEVGNKTLTNAIFIHLMYDPEPRHRTQRLIVAGLANVVLKDIKQIPKEQLVLFENACEAAMQVGQRAPGLLLFYTQNMDNEMESSNCGQVVGLLENHRLPLNDALQELLNLNRDPDSVKEFHPAKFVFVERD
ncbi:hypothetical protein JAAARDRAFT_200309 [Jaapia argillacea MUCL 33604]|uniref:MYND-type domain-containing protein n=1 Tax=Jaapia argillacea MUCL 33604 TaxID=933084 RepID=A0A067PGC4_9AGAM|nr:hypothetical protein JAAARDRAFT_200309 [Jaapia argillacea MUCL 33604]